MNTRPLTDAEMERFASERGVENLAVTCEGDYGYGPCGTYHDWIDGKCMQGHDIEIRLEDDA